MILDTTYFLDLRRERVDAFEKGVELHEERVVGRVPEVVFYELHYGVGRTQSDEELRRVRNVLMGYPSVDATPEIARRAGELLGRLDAEDGGNSGIDMGDAYVGATALTLDEPVLTRNVDDFERLGVDVESY